MRVLVINKSHFEIIFTISFILSCVFPIFPTYTNGMMYHVLGISLLPVLTLPFFLKVKLSDFIAFLIFFLIFLVATCITFINSNNDASDVFSGLKIIYFLLYSIVGYVYGYIVESPNEKFKKVYVCVLIISMLVSFVEIYIPGISFFLYKRESLDILSDKLTSLFNTTYHYAFFLFWGLCFYFTRFCYLVEKRVEVKSYFVNFMIAVVIFVLIFLTQSRNFILVSSILISIKVFNLFVKRVYDFKVIFFILMALVVGSSFLNYFSTEIETRFLYVVSGINYLISGGLDFSGGGSGSFNTRINQILFAWDAISSNPLFGVGVGKDIYLESIYAYLLYKYGIVGLVTFITIIIILSCISKRAELIVNNLDDKVFFNSCFWFFSLSPIYFLSGPLFEVPKLSMFFYCLIGLLVGSYRKYRIINGAFLSKTLSQKY